ncbi:MAG: hypothetical protein GY934_22960 [Gammaproteobacteria bacterium]|nr:hypothetical protein [Gammaproteobacteria bacterium]
MALIEWSQDLSVNVETADTHHKKLISMINSLHDAMHKSAATSYMVSTHFARLSKPNDRDRIAFVYPACNERYFTLWPR